jgi:hypothetical protein
MKPNFRHEARQALGRANVELCTGEEARLKYAALELRMAMEALTYDRAEAFSAELPPTDYDTWQPKKLLQLLLEIAPTADKDSLLSFGVEEEYGIAAPVMQSLGSEKVLNLGVLKRHYDALGSYLHMPTIKQIAGGKGADATKFRNRCQEIAGFVEAVLASPVFNVTLGSFAEMPCEACGATIRKRIPHGVPSIEARCFKCPASYVVEAIEENGVVWKPNRQQAFCAKPDCGTAILVWHHQVVPGNAWTCPECQSRNIICLGVSLVSSPPVP